MSEAFQWVELSPMRHGRRDARACLLPDGRVLLEGGTTWSHQARAVQHPAPELYDLRHDRWEPAPKSAIAASVEPAPVLPSNVKLRHRRERPTLTALEGGRLLVTGGFETFSDWGRDDKDDSVEQAELVDLARGVSVPAGTVRHARHAHAAVKLPCGAVLLLGGQHDDEPEATPKVELGLPRGVRLADLFAPEVARRIEEQLSNQHFERALETVRALRGKKPARRERLARAMTRRWPERDGAWAALGEALLEQGRAAEACRAYLEAVGLDPEDPFRWYELAAAQQANGDAENAAASCEKVIALTDDDDTWTWQIRKAALAGRSPIWNNQGTALMGQSRWNEALDAYQRALELDPSNSYAWGNRASALLRLKRPEEAVLACEKAIALSKSEPARCAGHWLTLGIAEYDRGRFADSVKAYDRSLKLAPSAAAWSNRGNSLLKLERFDAAMDSYRKAKDFPRAWWGRACLHNQRGRRADAQRAVDRALALDPSLRDEMREDEDLRGLKLGGGDK